MSWVQKLHDTYECAALRSDVKDEKNEKGEVIFLPTSHISQQAHIYMTLDGAGNLIDADIVAKENTLTPATEESAGRTGNCAPHPLNDKIQSVAGDYPDFGGKKKSYFDDVKKGKETEDGYLSLLTKWNDAFPNPKLKAVLYYVTKRTVVRDLVKRGILHLDEQGKLLTDWKSDEGKQILKFLSHNKDQGDAFVRWKVEIEGVNETKTWSDENLVESWKAFDSKLPTGRGVCYVTGTEQSLGTKHPSRLRHGKDKAKLISSDDTAGYTYRGRFTNSEQACSIGYETSQKAHNALRWLIQRQAFRNGDQVVLAWEVQGKNVPHPLSNSHEIYEKDENDSMEIQIGGASEKATRYDGDFWQLQAQRLNAKIEGYRRELNLSKDIIVMGLDSATSGRMAITYYRELSGSDFLGRIEAWHNDFAWFQNYSKDVKFWGAPSPKEIAEAAFGRRLDAKISKSTVNRLLPCIVDGVPFPRDLVQSTRNRAVNRMGMEHWEWEKVLGIACALFRGTDKNKGGYQMTLETKRDSRDYLYGRLLAVAEYLEQIALYLTEEKRDTNAAKLMQRFAERPCSTWLQIEQALVPYKTRLQTKRAPFLTNMKNLIDEIHCLFNPGDYVKDEPLTGEFLLGYHCQRRELWLKTKNEEENNANEEVN